MKNDLEKADFKKILNNLPHTEADNYQCSLCQDTGWVLKDETAYPCACRKQSYLAKRKENAGITAALLEYQFDNFNLGYYADYLQSSSGSTYRQLAEKTFSAAKHFAYSAAKNQARRGIMLEGDIGVGKTFLAAAIANYLVEHDIDVLFLIVPEFLDQLRFSYQENSNLNESTIVDRARHIPVLILDDLGAHNFSPWMRNMIFTLINYRLNNLLPCIITTNLNLTEMNDAIGYRTVSRIIEMCEIHRLCAEKDIRRSKLI